ncbi:MAG: DNA-processing protein DprA, partial [Phascolarctobacterium sp.]
MDKVDTLYLAAIVAVGGLGRAKVMKLVQSLGSARAVFEADVQKLVATGVVKEDAAAAFTDKRRKDVPTRLQRFCDQQGVRLVSYKDADYPQSLLRIADPPLVLYVKGILPAAGYALAVVGSRECTEYGKKAAKVFTKDLAMRDIPIISGGARGIDTEAHEACLSVGGKTVAVLGCGLDIAYPEENAGLFERIVRSGGAVISEYAPGTRPLAKNFPARNRIIVGLSQGVLVAEAKLKSGAIITANIAADEGRDVYCVPGNIFDNTSKGCHELIRTGAKLVDTPQDILED